MEVGSSLADGPSTEFSQEEPGYFLCGGCALGLPSLACQSDGGWLIRAAMKSYVITTGVVFGLIALAHGLRIFDEGLLLVTEPMFALTSVLSAGLCLWAWRVARRKDAGK